MKRLVAGAAALALGLGLAACSSGSGDGGGAGNGSQTLTLAIETAPNLDYTQAGSGGSPVLSWQTSYDTLLRFAPDGTVEPYAAESYEMNEDATEMTLVIREGMKFADGSDVDAAAVKASLEHNRDSGGPDSVRLAGLEFETPDASTVVIHSPEPRGLLPSFLSLSTGVIANPAFLGQAEGDEVLPHGSGPYVLDEKETTSGSTYTFVRNEEYWNKAEFPYDKVVLRVLEDETARISALRTGQVNAGFVSTQSRSQVDNGEFNLVKNDVNWAGLIIFDRDGEMVPALGDERVRQAINMVFDRDAIGEALFQGHASPTNQIFNTGSEAYNADLLKKQPYDIEAAKKLIADAGYADGFEITIPSLPGLNSANPMIIQQLSELNIRVVEESVAPTAFLTDILGGKFPVMYMTLESRIALWDIVQSVEPTSIWNVKHNESPELAPLLAQVQSAQGDEAKALYQEINEVIVDLGWFAPWVLVEDAWALTSDTQAEAILGSQAPYLYTFHPAK